MDSEHVERVEAKLNAFIEKRARERADEDRVATAWAESACKDAERRRQERTVTPGSSTSGTYGEAAHEPRRRAPR